MPPFLIKLLASVSEEVVMDIFRAVVREYMLARKKGDISKAAADLKGVIAEVESAEGMSNDEKNSKLIDAGRPVINRLRKP